MEQVVGGRKISIYEFWLTERKYLISSQVHHSSIIHKKRERIFSNKRSSSSRIISSFLFLADNRCRKKIVSRKTSARHLSDSRFVESSKPLKNWIFHQNFRVERHLTFFFHEFYDVFLFDSLQHCSCTQPLRKRWDVSRVSSFISIYIQRDMRSPWIRN